MINKQQLIETLKLETHPSEGGYFRRTYASALEIAVPYTTAPRCSMTSIFYLLTDDKPLSYLHRNQADIVHYFQLGSPVTYYVVHPDGQLETVVLGPELAAGQRLQLTVSGGCWKASQLLQGEYALISEAVSPGFDYADSELATHEMIKRAFPQLQQQLSALIKPV